MKYLLNGAKTCVRDTSLYFHIYGVGHYIIYFLRLCIPTFKSMLIINSRGRNYPTV